jgi:hypothetical protein
MNEIHEILCPNFIQCDICQRIREGNKISQIEKFTGNLESEIIENYHFYILEITHKPNRETYFRFTLNPLKKAGRDLVNGLSSISGVSNRKWWKMFVEAGIKFYSIKQVDKEDFPTYKLSFLMYSKKDNIDNRMHHQLKYRLMKINKNLEFNFKYIGKYDLDKIIASVDIAVDFDYLSIPIQKLDIGLIMDMNKMKNEKAVIFGRQYYKNKLTQPLDV